MRQPDDGETRTCRDCGESFDLARKEIEWFEQHDYDLPRRCKACRAARRGQPAQPAEPLTYDTKAAHMYRPRCRVCGTPGVAPGSPYPQCAARTKERAERVRRRREEDDLTSARILAMRNP